MQTAGDRSERKAMIEKHHSQLSVRKQCELLAVNRNRLSPRQPKRVEGDEAIMKEIDRIYTEFPFYGARKIVIELRDAGIRIGRKRCRRLMKKMGIEALVTKPSTSIPDKQHRKYPYLLRESAVSNPDEVWAADICLRFARPSGSLRLAVSLRSAPTSQCMKVTSIWWRSWIGTRRRSFRGAFRRRWTRVSEWRRIERP